MDPISRVVARNSAFGIGAQIAIKLLSFGFSVFIVRHLGPDAFGQYAAVLAFGAMFVFLADLGLSPYAVREVARWRDDPQGLERTGALYGRVMGLRLVLSIVAAILLIGAAWLTGRPLLMVGAIALGGLGLVLFSLQGTSDAVLAGFERLDLSATARVINQLVFVFAGGVALWLGFGYYGLMLANVLGAAVIAFLCWRWVRRLGVRVPRGVCRDWASLLRASLPFGIGTFALGLSYKFDSVLLNIFRGDRETGLYNAAYNLVFSAAFLSNAVNTALYPSLTRQMVSKPESLPAVCERVLRYLFVLSLPIAVGATALAGPVMGFLFTDAYAAAVPALRIVIWVTPLMFASEFLGYVVLIQRQEHRAARAIVVSTTANAVLNLLLVPRFGFVAAAVMTVATEAVLVGQYAWMLRGLLAQLNWDRTLLRPAAAAFLMGGLALALRGLLLPLDVAISGLAYCGLLVAFGVIGREELRFARGLRKPSVAALSAVSAGELAGTGDG